MRNAILVMTVALTLASGQLQARPPKSRPADVGRGGVAWFDISTPNLQQSRELDGKLFDWTFTPLEGTDLAVEIVARGSAIGTLRGREGGSR